MASRSPSSDGDETTALTLAVSGDTPPFGRRRRFGVDPSVRECWGAP
jgi:hypothetical protein